MPENIKYSILYADPPWSFKVWNRDTGSGRSAESHYRTMSLEQIKALPVNEIAEKNSVLFLWAVNPSLPEAIEVMTAWGFTYKTVGFTWVKETMSGKDHVGMGYYTRANAELCLLATKGKPLSRQSRSVRQLIRAKVGRHSEKPAEVRDRIVELFGDLPRLEMFAREKVSGWDSWGNEVLSDIELEAA
ncbi:MT-A70 family methyltransferase [Nitrosococcus wardiae]|uniref:Adenine methyltransferase n=1 Tax=Nitrosococcus wardiae TaxID=1814290 RepID=A0A4P7BXQ1_9GAMM|nr:MT-A70 family methyltransferase [Nitrosococcus wardiae]QBQ54948.1 adenine methyltransferase [Nitrosococcus wardiae]